MRRFEFQDGTSNKFWEVEIAGADLLLRWGKIGTRGQRKTKTFESAEASATEEKKLIAEKTGKGYVEASAPPPKPATARPPPEATRTLLRDARGNELILTLQGASVMIGEGKSRVVQTLDSADDAKDHCERVINLRRKQGFNLIDSTQVAAVSVEPPSEAFAVDGFDGELRTASSRTTITFKGPPDRPVLVATCKALIDRIARDAPRSVQLICDFGIPGRSWEHALAAMRLESIEGFIFDTHFQTQTRQRNNSIGNLAAMFDACPNLRQLFATGDLALRPTRHRALQALHLNGDPLSPAVIKALGASQFPALERLVVSHASDNGKADDAVTLEALLALRAPKLREVHLSSVTNVPKFVEMLADRGIPASWKILSLAGTWDGAYGADEIRPALEKHLPALKALQALGLTLHDDELAELRATLPFVHSQSEWSELFLPKTYDTW